MKVFVALLCVTLVAAASGSPAKSWLSTISDAVSDSVGKATNIASEKGKEGLAKVQELIAQLQKQAEKVTQDLQNAAGQAEKVTQQYLLKQINEQLEKLKKLEEKLSGWMGKN